MMDRRESIKAEVEALPMNMPCDPPFDIDAELRKAYDPVAVLEAMRDWQICVRIKNSGSFCGSSLVVVDSTMFGSVQEAVLFLHKQAAQVDPEFAERWPVPE